MLLRECTKLYFTRNLQTNHLFPYTCVCVTNFSNLHVRTIIKKFDYSLLKTFDRLRAALYGDRIPEGGGARYSTPIQTSSGVEPAPVKCVPGLLLEGKADGA